MVGFNHFQMQAKTMKPKRTRAEFDRQLRKLVKLAATLNNVPTAQYEEFNLAYRKFELDFAPNGKGLDHDQKT